MLKPWSITTTVRNPERLRDFLIVLQNIAGQKWDLSAQQQYQKLLIKHRLYGYGNSQFYSGLPDNITSLINDPEKEITYTVIEKILQIKKYKDFAMRGRQSLNPLTKFGFAYIDDSVVKITDLGKKLILNSNDLGEIFLKSFIKWQIPNPANDDFSDDGKYNTVPFVATLKLIDTVNKIELSRNNKPKGLSKREFCLFCPSLIKYENIEVYAKYIIKFRDIQKNKTAEERKLIRDKFRTEFIKKYLYAANSKDIEKVLKNLKDYGDNAIRYFRLTKFIRIRGNGFYIDLEPNRLTEINSLIEQKYYIPQNFKNKKDYLLYMANDSLPILPWQTKEKLTYITKNLTDQICELQNRLKTKNFIFKNILPDNVDGLNVYITELRTELAKLHQQITHINAQPIQAIENYIDKFESIYTYENRPLMLEYITTLGLHALNDAKEIKPNYPLGDDNEPTSTAPGNVADIECYYKDFNMICEVTILKSRDQWFNEGQPVMRHLRNFENINSNACCMFIAPAIHTDTAETFFIANKFGYKGTKQKIAPITIKQFIDILKTLKILKQNNKIFRHKYLKNLIDDITGSTDSLNNSDLWIKDIENILLNWKQNLLNLKEFL